MLKSRIKRSFARLVPEKPALAVLLISLTALLTYGLIIPRLGYYHDDWYMLWSGASRGAASMLSLFSTDRPFIGVIYALVYSWLRESIPGWHMLTLAMRIAGALAFYWILNLAWPRPNRSLYVLTSMLFVVFPGFLAEPNAATKINHLIGYGAALFSIAFTLKAARTERRLWQIGCAGLALLLMALYLWIYEYMLGLEVMRVSLLFWVFYQGQRDRTLAAAKRVLRSYIPYLAVLGAFLFWRVFIFESTRNATDLKGLISAYDTNSTSMLIRLGLQVLKDFLSSSVFSWFVEPYYLLAQASYAEITMAVLTAGAAFLIAYAYVRAVSSAEVAAPETVPPMALICLGALITAAAVFPVVLSNRFLDLMDPYKGYALHPSAGVLIMGLGFISMLRPRFRNATLITLLVLSVGTQSLNNQNWANYWAVQEGFWWQLTWRAPDIRDNTLVMAYAPNEYKFQQDYEIWGPLNLIYSQEPLSVPPIQAEVLNDDTALQVIKGSVTDPYDRDIFVPKNYQNLLLISQPSTNACIHVIDGHMPLYPTNERAIVRQVGRFSNLDRIDPSTTSPTPPEAIFGQEPAHDWCYYYQKAELAKQAGDWARIGALYDAAAAAGLKAADPSEYFVFVEGLVNLGREDEAKTVAEHSILENEGLVYSLCRSLTAPTNAAPAAGYRLATIREITCRAVIDNGIQRQSGFSQPGLRIEATSNW